MASYDKYGRPTKSYANKGERRFKRTPLGIGILVFCLVLAAIYYIVTQRFGEVGTNVINPEATFHFIDVGQGDCSMFLCDDGAIVVDAGPTSSAYDTFGYIRSNTESITYLILTHPDEDHIGGAANLINNMQVDNVIMTAESKSTKTFTKLLDALENSRTRVIQAKVGKTYTVGEMSVEILWPNTLSNDSNENSVVSKITYKNVSVLATGDAEKKIEKQLIEKYGDKLSSNILKLGHHGSSTSTSVEFLQCVNPSYSIISCGKDNSYGHPHKETVELLNGYAATYYRTDEVGTVVFETDGTNLAYVDKAADSTALK